MTGRNSVPYIHKSIQSALFQQYDNYEIILFDAESDDGSYDIALDYVNKNPERLTVIRNNPRRFQGKNILEGTKLSTPRSIIVTLDSDDWFPNENILSYLNDIYINEVWMTYGGSYIESTDRDVRNVYSAYPNEVIDGNTFREHRWLGSHIRTFRRELFLNINEEDLKDSDTGEFYAWAPDLGFMWPMLEMSGHHAKYLNEILYIYNTETPYNENKQAQTEIERIEKQVRAKPKYKKLEQLYAD